jgi:hypothetical protein
MNDRSAIRAAQVLRVLLRIARARKARYRALQYTRRAGMDLALRLHRAGQASEQLPLCRLKCLAHLALNSSKTPIMRLASGFDPIQARGECLTLPEPYRSPTARRPRKLAKRRPLHRSDRLHSPCEPANRFPGIVIGDPSQSVMIDPLKQALEGHHVLRPLLSSANHDGVLQPPTTVATIFEPISSGLGLGARQLAVRSRRSTKPILARSQSA